ncbi:hypothetical protein ACQ4PT_020441 [Festuca glaucescens]
MAPPDPILGVSEAFKADTSDLKLNLGVGAYRTEELQPAVLNVVKKAENLMLEKGEFKEYLPIEGLAAFNKATADLLLGPDNLVIKQGRVATLQSLSGTGSLRLAAAFIQRYFPDGVTTRTYSMMPGYLGQSTGIMIPRLLGWILRECIPTL